MNNVIAACLSAIYQGEMSQARSEIEVYTWHDGKYTGP